MKLRAFVAAAALLVGMACAYSVSVGKEEDAKADASQLIGTWKLVSAKYGGQEAGFPVGMTMLKHVTPEQFMWARYDADGQVLAAAGGTYEVKGEAYAESPRYGLGADFDGVFRTCPQCGSPATNKPSFTWWGGILGPAIFKHRVCSACSFGYNERTGKSNSTAIGIYLGVGIFLAIVVVLLRIAAH